MKTLRSILLATSMLVMFAACSKETVLPEVPEEPQQEEQVTVPEAVDILTKSLSKEDFEGVGVFVKDGDTDGTLYFDITKEGESIVSGEIGIAMTEEGRELYLDLMIMNALPVKGTVDVVPFTAAYMQAKASVFSMDICYLFLRKVNANINITVANFYDLTFEVVKDPETCRNSIIPYLISLDGGSKISLVDLFGMFFSL